MDKNYLSERRSEIGNRLREARVKAGLTQAETADLIDCSRVHINRAEQGTTDLTGIELELLAQAFDVPVTYFFRRLEEYSEKVPTSRSTNSQAYLK